MTRHRFDPLSAVLGVLAGVFAVMVMSGSLGLMTDDSVGVVAVVALLIGVALIPWGLRRADATAITTEATSEPDTLET